MGTGCISAFVIWRSAWEELHRSAPLSKIYSRFTENIHVFAKSDHSFLRRQGTACSLCWAFSVENPSLSTSPSWTSQRQITQNIWCTNWNICIRKTWSNPTLNSISNPLTSVGLCRCKPAQEAAWSTCRECLPFKQILVIINTQIYLQEAPSKGMPQWGSPAAPKRGYHSLSSTIPEFFKQKLAHWGKHFARRPRDYCHCNTSTWTEIQQYNILLSSLVQVSTCEPHTECCTRKNVNNREILILIGVPASPLPRHTHPPPFIYMVWSSLIVHNTLFNIHPAGQHKEASSPARKSQKNSYHNS